MPPLNQYELQALLNAWLTPAAPANRPDFVIVVDVGQGNLNAICNANGQPFLYYDFGGGMNGSLFTYPDPTPAFCSAANPKYILSHWDVDHIKTANLLITSGGLLNTVWLAPDQKTRKASKGISKAASSLRTKMNQNTRRLRIWPDGSAVPSITASHFSVLKVDGNGVNDSGLALRIANPAGGGAFMLLVGDASYQNGTFDDTVHGCDRNCVGLVSSHHGAEVDTEDDLPRPQPQGFGAATSRAVAFSFGLGNFFGHPSTTGVDAYTDRGWQDLYRLDTCGAEASADIAGARGNIGMVWPGAARGPGWVSTAARTVDVQRAAVALIAAAVAELDLYQATVAGVHGVAVAAAHQAALEAAEEDGVTDDVACVMRLDNSPLGDLVFSGNAAAAWSGLNKGLGRRVILSVALNGAGWFAGTASGLFRSTDNGANWAPIASAGNEPVLAVTAHPTNNAILLIGRSNGLFGSSDSGATWTRVVQMCEGPIHCLTYDASNANYVYAATDAGLFRSDNIGVAWAPKFGTLEVNDIAVHPTNEQYVLAATPLGLFLSTDAGGSWTVVPSTTGQAILAVAFDTQVPTTIYVGKSDGLFRSVNTGGNWTGSLIGNQQVQAIAVKPDDSAGIVCGLNNGLGYTANGGTNWLPVAALNNVSVLTVDFDRNATGTILAGTAGSGIWRTLNGAPWAALPIAGRTDGNVRSIAISPTGVQHAYMVLGTALFATANTGGAWLQNDPGIGLLKVAFAPSNRNRLYAASRGRVLVSANAGDAWTWRLGPGFNVQAVAVDRNNPTRVYLGQRVGLFGSNDRGDNAVPNATFGGAGVQSIAVDSTNSANLYVGTATTLRLSTNAGGAWVDCLTLGPMSVRAVAANGANILAGGSVQFTLLQIAHDLAAVGAGRFQDALTHAAAIAAAANNVHLKALARRSALAALTATGRVAHIVTQEAFDVHVQLDGRPIGSQAPIAVNNALYELAQAGTAAAAGVAARAECANVETEARNLSGLHVPAAADIEDVVERAAVVAMRAQLGSPGSTRGRTPSVQSKTPPLVGEAVAVDGTFAGAGVRDDVKAALAAAAALSPPGPVNPEAAPPAVITVNLHSLRAARVGAVAAIIGVQTLTLARAVKGAVAAARVALPCALGAPQIGCHRYPRQCGASRCSLSIHYHVRNP